MVNNASEDRPVSPSDAVCPGESDAATFSIASRAHPVVTGCLAVDPQLRYRTRTRLTRMPSP